MAVIETRLSSRVEAGFSVIPQRMTEVTPLRNGHEVRNARWDMARRRYTSRYAQYTRADRDELLAAIMATDGQTFAFLFKDWNDFRVTGQSLGAAPAGTTAVQLVKTYTFGSQTHTRTITRPVAGRLTVYEDDMTKPGSVSATTGLFTPTDAWIEGAAVTADFEFDVTVRFASDEVEFVLPHREIMEVNVELIEVFGE